MKLTLTAKHLSLALAIFFVVTIFACKSDKGEVVVAAPEIIRMVGVDMATGQCIMTDESGGSADTFKIDAGKKVQWLIQTNAIQDVTNIFKKSTSSNIFSEEPHRLGNSTTWEGTISSSATGQEEDYNITWTDQAGATYLFDPKIQVK
ncbi:MAG: hypothetical protein ABIR81_00380 [Ginsengibacter sp.]